MASLGCRKRKEKGENPRLAVTKTTLTAWPAIGRSKETEPGGGNTWKEGGGGGKPATSLRENGGQFCRTKTARGRREREEKQGNVVVVNTE